MHHKFPRMQSFIVKEKKNKSPPSKKNTEASMMMMIVIITNFTLSLQRRGISPIPKKTQIRQ